ncbi:MAG: hypothetical protein LUI04_06045 [Porphyromonadaceae bacterium]|nr:hypothetical protein [Porphyromonadaceae bacterium]
MANWNRERRPKTDAEQNREALLRLMEMPPQELTEVIRSNMLPVSLSVEARGWLDLKRGPENLRRSMERVFVKNSQLKN